MYINQYKPDIRIKNSLYNFDKTLSLSADHSGDDEQTDQVL